MSETKRLANYSRAAKQAAYDFNNPHGNRQCRATGYRSAKAQTLADRLGYGL